MRVVFLATLAVFATCAAITFTEDQLAKMLAAARKDPTLSDHDLVQATLDATVATNSQPPLLGQGMKVNASSPLFSFHMTVCHWALRNNSTVSRRRQVCQAHRGVQTVYTMRRAATQHAARLRATQTRPAPTRSHSPTMGVSSPSSAPPALVSPLEGVRPPQHPGTAQPPLCTSTTGGRHTCSGSMTILARANMGAKRGAMAKVSHGAKTTKMQVLTKAWCASRMDRSIPEYTCLA